MAETTITIKLTPPEHRTLVEALEIARSITHVEGRDSPVLAKRQEAKKQELKFVTLLERL